MTIYEQIKSELKEAMKAKDSAKLEVVRGLLAAFTNELVATGQTPQSPVEDDLAMRVLNKAAKQRKDSQEQFEKGGRPELAAKEATELKFIETYLPELMGEDEVRKVVEAKIAELGVTDKSKIGILIGAVMKELAGKADGALVKKVVEESL